MIPATQRVAAVSPEVVDGYKRMRATAMDDVGSHRFLCEVVITAQLAALGHGNSFKVHARQLMANGLEKEALQKILVSGIGATLVIPQVAEILDWLDEAAAAL